MEKRKILVYDNSKGFTRFIKLNFSNIFEVEGYLNFNEHQHISFQDYSAAFFIVNDHHDLVDLLLAYTKVKPLFVASRIPELIRNIQALEDVTVVNLSQGRQEMLDHISFYLKLYALS